MQRAVPPTKQSDMSAAPSVIVINLDRDADRLAHMRSELGKFNLAFERFEALRGTALPEQLKPYFPASSDGDRSTLSMGEIGCYASHLAVCKKIVEGEITAPVLVLEDDIELAPNFVTLLDNVLKLLPQDWDFVRLSNEAKHAVMPLYDLGGGRTLVRYTNVPTSTGASLVSRSGAEKFLKQAPRSLPVDQDLRRVWTWELNTFGILPAPVRRDIFDVSSIDAMTDAGWRTKSFRIARFRRQRMNEALSRFAYGTRTFGLARWFAAEVLNVVIALTPKQRRAVTLARLSERLRPRTPQERSALGLQADEALTAE